MLQAIRDHAQGWIAWVIVGLIILTFALFGIDQYAKGDKTIVVAEVNGQDVTANDFLSLYNRQKNRLEQQFGDMYDQVVKDDKLREEVMDALIESAVINQWAEKEAMIVSDQQLAATIQSAPVFQKDGKFDDAVYKNILLRNGLNVARFEYEQRQFLIENQFRQLTKASSLITQHQVDRLLALQLQQRKLNYLRVDQRPFMNKAVITDDQVAEYYAQNKMSYVEPEKVQIEYLALSQAELAKKVAVSEEGLQDFYNDNKTSFSIPEKRQASHILIRTDEALSDEEALKKITAIEAELKAGKDFSESAKINSQDPGSAKMGGDLGMFQQGMMVPEFDDAVFGLKLGEISKPIKTEFGYHLIKLTKIEPKKTQPFSEVKGQVEKEYRAQTAEKEYFKLLEKMNSIAYEQPDSLIAAADAVGGTLQVSKPFSKDGGSSEITSDSKVISMAFSDSVLKEKMNSSSIELSPSSSVIIRVKEYFPERQKPLEEVSANILKELKRQAGIKASNALAKEILAKVNAGETMKSFEKEGVEWSVVGWLDRENRTVLPQITAEVFKMKKPTEGKSSFNVMQLSTGDSLVLELLEVKQSDEAASPKQAKEMRTSLADLFGNASVEARIKALVETAKIEKKSNYLTIK